MKNQRLFKVYYLPATRTAPSRLKIKDLRHRKTLVVSRRYDNTYDMEAKDFASVILREKGIEPTFYGESERGFIVGTDDFLTQIK